MQNKKISPILICRLFVLSMSPFMASAGVAASLENDCRKNASEESFHQEALIACKSLYESLNARDKWLILRFGRLLEQNHSLKLAYYVYADGVRRYDDSAIRARYEIVQTLIEEEDNQIVIRPTQTSISRESGLKRRRSKIKCRVKLAAGSTDIPEECAGFANAGSNRLSADQRANAATLADASDASVDSEIRFSDSTQSVLPLNSTTNIYADVYTSVHPGRSNDTPEPRPADTTTGEAKKQQLEVTPTTTQVPVADHERDISKLETQLADLRQLVEEKFAAQEVKRVTGDDKKQTDVIRDLRPRHALVIGNARYASESKQLQSPENDAGDVASALQQLGFDVTLRLNVSTQSQFESELLAYQKVLSQDSDSVGVLFYAGHAVQFDGKNYLIPTETRIRGPQDVRAKSLSMDYVQDTLAFADNGLNIVVLDACRDNPFKSFTRTTAEGLVSSRDSTDGYLVIYAARPGYQAIDSAGRNSPFTKHFLRTIKDSSEPVELMFKRLARAVDEETNGAQTPWLEGQYLGDFIFKPTRKF